MEYDYKKPTKFTFFTPKSIFKCSTHHSENGYTDDDPLGISYFYMDIEYDINRFHHNQFQNNALHQIMDHKLQNHRYQYDFEYDVDQKYDHDDHGHHHYDHDPEHNEMEVHDEGNWFYAIQLCPNKGYLNLYDSKTKNIYSTINNVNAVCFIIKKDFMVIERSYFSYIQCQNETRNNLCCYGYIDELARFYNVNVPNCIYHLCFQFYNDISPRLYIMDLVGNNKNNTIHITLPILSEHINLMDIDVIPPVDLSYYFEIAQNQRKLNKIESLSFCQRCIKVYGATDAVGTITNLIQKSKLTPSEVCTISLH